MKLRKMTIIAMLALSSLLFAKGAAEQEREYRRELQVSFERIIGDVESGGLTSREGKVRLNELRLRYNRSFSDEFGIMESIIDQVAEGNLSLEEALYEYSLLRKGNLMEYRQSKSGADGGSSGGANSSGESSGASGSSSGQGGENKGGGNGEGEGKREAIRNRF